MRGRTRPEAGSRLETTIRSHLTVLPRRPGGKACSYAGNATSDIAALRAIGRPPRLCVRPPPGATADPGSDRPSALHRPRARDVHGADPGADRRRGRYHLGDLPGGAALDPFGVRLPREHGRTRCCATHCCARARTDDHAWSGHYHQPDPPRVHFTITANATFWDGSPVTAADACSASSAPPIPTASASSLSVHRVTSITATGTTRWRSCSQDGHWLPGELSGPAGMIVERVREAKGRTTAR